MDLSNLVSAHKRAKHFGSVQFAGPFSVLGTTGPFIAARNYCMLLDARGGDEVAVEFPATDNPDILALRAYVTPLGNEFMEDMVLLDSWARAINRYCDSHMIANDEDAKIAFACFHSRLFFDPSKLVK